MKKNSHFFSLKVFWHALAYTFVQKICIRNYFIKRGEIPLDPWKIVHGFP